MDVLIALTCHQNQWPSDLIAEALMRGAVKANVRPGEFDQHTDEILMDWLLLMVPAGNA